MIFGMNFRSKAFCPIRWTRHNRYRLFLALEAGMAKGKEGAELMARNTSETIPAGEYSGEGGRKGRPDGYKAMSSEQANLERHQAALRTNPADPASGELEGDQLP